MKSRSGARRHRYVARADDHAAARAEVGATVEHLLAGLQAPA
jgi:hypothetical protein